jgi:predicted nucleic acid-binding protein
MGHAGAQGFQAYSEAAILFRASRAKGIAVTTVDALIAAIALERGASRQDSSRWYREPLRNHLND